MTKIQNKLGIFFFIIVFFCIILFNLYSRKREGFWSQDTVQNFVQTQQTINPNVIFDTDVIQQQVSESDVNTFLQNNTWTWSDDVQNIYKDASSKNQYVKTLPEESMTQAQKIYNEKSILDILSQQTKEGQFLMNGVEVVTENDDLIKSGEGSFGVTSGLTTSKNNKNSKLITCQTDINGNSTAKLKQYQYTGNGLLGEHTYKISDVDYNDLENTIPGFQYINGPCNPCSNLNPSSSNYQSCPFELNIRNSSGTSAVWKHLWNL